MELLILILGICIGSFLNVLIDRFPREESVVEGRSHCEKCKKTLQWFDLVPLLSFLQLRGKCRYCRTRLSFYYPVVELTTGIMLTITFFLVSSNLQISSYNFQSIFNLQFLIPLIYYLFVVSCLVVVFFADLKYGIIPDKIIFPAVLISFLYLILNAQYQILLHLFSAAGAGLFFLILFLGTRGKGMGFGDVKFAFLMGLILGYPNIIVSLYVAFLTGAIVGIILILWRRKKVFGTAIPFGPFLVSGTLLALFWGNAIFQKAMSLVLR